MLRIAGQHEEAVAYRSRQLEAMRTLRGADNPETLLVQNLLVQDYRHIGQDSRAEELEQDLARRQAATPTTGPLSTAP